MQKQSLPPAPEDQREALVRAALQEHAAPVDLDQAWAVVAPRIFAQHQQSHRLNWRRVFSVVALRPAATSRWSRKSAVAALALCALLVMGAGFVAFAGPWNGLVKGTNPTVTSQFTNVGQQRQSHGVTLTVTQVYADLGRTIIAFDINGPAAWTQQYSGIAGQSYTLSDQNESQSKPASSVICNRLSQSGFPVHCVAIFSPFHPSAGAKTLTITWEVNGLTLSNSQGQRTPYAGTWRFQFTVPFHWQDQNPGQPQVTK